MEISEPAPEFCLTPPLGCHRPQTPLHSRYPLRCLSGLLFKTRLPPCLRVSVVNSRHRSFISQLNTPVPICVIRVKPSARHRPFRPNKKNRLPANFLFDQTAHHPYSAIQALSYQLSQRMVSCMPANGSLTYIVRPWETESPNSARPAMNTPLPGVSRRPRSKNTPFQPISRPHQRNRLITNDLTN